MGLFSWFGEKFFGDVITDYGTLPSQVNGWSVSITLRKKGDGSPYLLFKWRYGTNTTWTSLACSREVRERLESILRDSCGQGADEAE